MAVAAILGQSYEPDYYLLLLFIIIILLLFYFTIVYYFIIDHLTIKRQLVNYTPGN